MSLLVAGVLKLNKLIAFDDDGIDHDREVVHRFHDDTKRFENVCGT